MRKVENLKALLQETKEIKEALREMPPPTEAEKFVQLSKLPEGHEFVTFFETELTIGGTYPTTLAKACAKLSLPEAELKRFAPIINQGLVKRGHDPVPYLLPFSEKKALFEDDSQVIADLREKQLVNDGVLLDSRFVAAVNMICDSSDKRNRTAIFKALGISSARFNGLMAKPNHREYFEAKLKEAWGQGDYLAKKTVLKGMESGDLQAVKYFYELTNVYRPNQDLLINIGILVGKLMEVLSKYLDRDALLEIADSFDSIILQTKQQVIELEAGSN